MDETHVVVCRFEGFGEAIPCDGEWEDSEEALREAALAGEEEHQAEASPFQDGKKALFFPLFVCLRSASTFFTYV